MMPHFGHTNAASAVIDTHLHTKNDYRNPRAGAEG